MENRLNTSPLSPISSTSADSTVLLPSAELEYDRTPESSNIDDGLEKETEIKVNLNLSLELPQSDENPSATGTTLSSSINLINTILGAGLLGIPKATASSGLFLSLALISLVLYVTHCSLDLLLAAAARLPSSQKPNYHCLARYSFPAIKYGRGPERIACLLLATATFTTIVAFLIIIADVSVPIVATVSGIPEANVNRALMQIISMMVILPLASLKNLDSLSSASILSLIALFYVSLAVTFRGVRHIYDVGFSNVLGCNEQGVCVLLFIPDVHGVLNTISVVTLAFCCHMNVFTIRKELIEPTPKRFKNVLWIGLLVSYCAYLLSGFMGYTAFGDGVRGNILLNFNKSDKIMFIARILVVISFVLSVPIMSHPCINNLEKLEMPGSRQLKVNLVCLAALAVASAVADVGFLFTVFGGPASVLMAFILPSTFYWMLVPKDKATLYWRCVLVFSFGAFHILLKVIIPVLIAVTSIIY
eukprot:m.6368 g.6368  ORF g.6368 m.6368 type:complete len:476 (-) comp3521_c0_seq2:1088-2515(-)